MDQQLLFRVTLAKSSASQRLLSKAKLSKSSAMSVIVI